MIYVELLWSFFQIGLFSFGGGYAAMPLIQHQVVEVHPWLTMAEFTDIITISQMAPGSISINSATFIGLYIAGWPGALVATFGCILPSGMIITALAIAYARFRSVRVVRSVLLQLRSAVVSMIALAGLSILFLSLWGRGKLPMSTSALADKLISTDWIALFIFCASLCVLRIWKKIDPLHVMLGSGIIGIVLYTVLPALFG